jgi:biotin synthase
MNFNITSNIKEILVKSQDDGITRQDAKTLLQLPLQSIDTYALMYAADRLSREEFKNKGENHFHIGINIEPCPYNCRFCSLAQKAGVFSDSVEFSQEQIVKWAVQGEAQGVDALNIMTGGTLAFENLLEIGRVLKKNIKTPLVANTRDITRREGEMLLDAGFVGASN